MSEGTLRAAASTWLSSLRTHLAFLVLLALVPAFALIHYTASDQRRMAAQEARDDAWRLAQEVASEHERRLEGARQLLAGLAQLPEVRRRDVPACTVLFRRIHAQFPFYTNVAAVEPDGDIFCSAVPQASPVNIADRAFFRYVLEKRDFVASEYLIGRTTGKPNITLAYPSIDASGSVGAVVFVGLDVAWLGRWTAEVGMRAGITLTLFDRAGVVLARHPDPEHLVGRQFAESELVKTAVERRQGTVELRGLDGVRRLHGFTVLPSASQLGDAFVSVGIPTDVAHAAADSMLRRNLLWLGLGTLLALGGAWAAGHRLLVRPVDALVEAAGRLGTGDFSARTGLRHDASEVGQLAGAFDRMVATLEREQQFSHALLENLAEGVIACDHNGVLAMLNRTAREWHGIDAHPVASDRWASTYDLYGPDGTVPLTTEELPLVRAFRGERVRDAEIAIVPRGRPARHVVASGDPLRDSTGATLGAVVVMHDITERKRAAEALARRAADLARSNAELEQFAYIASHDLQEPLRMVASYTQLLARRYKGQLDPDADEFIAYAVEGAHRMQRLIDDLLMYSRVGTRGGRFEPADANAVVDGVLADLRVAIDESGAVVTREALPSVVADAVQLGQVFQNLIGNAIKFRSEAPPRVHVRVARTNGAWRFSVQDNGIGIDPAYAERIFLVFKRLHGPGRYQGTGIGLAVCKKIVERHGGRIWMESRSGEGATFHFTLPICGRDRDDG